MDTPLTLGNPAPVAPATTEVGAPFPLLKNHLRLQEIAHLHRAIEHSAGDKKKAAVLLGVSLATLYRKLDGA